MTFLSKYFDLPDPTNKHKKHDLEHKTPLMHDQIERSSSFLGMFIRASEMWTKPSTSWEQQTVDNEKGLLSSAMTYTFGMYCMLRTYFSDPACSELVKSHPKIDFTNLKGLVPFTYEPDEYWQRVVVIPAYVSAMVITGGLDFQTVQELGEAEYEHLSGEKKVLIEFENGGHCAGISGSTFGDKTRCGVKMIASFVFHSGHVDKVDTTCMNDLSRFNFADLKAIKQAAVDVKSADELYDSKPQ